MAAEMAKVGATESNPSDSRPNFFGRQNLTFDKGGKNVSNFRGIVRVWEGWCGASGGCERVVGMERGLPFSADLMPFVPFSLQLTRKTIIINM